MKKLLAVILAFCPFYAEAATGLSKGTNNECPQYVKFTCTSNTYAGISGNPGTLVVTNTGVAGQFVSYVVGSPSGVQTGAWKTAAGAGDVMAAGDFTQFLGLGGTNGQVFISLGTGIGAWTNQSGSGSSVTTNGFWYYVSGTQYVNFATQTLAQTIPTTNGFWAYVSGTQYVNSATQTLAQTIPSTNGFWAYVSGTQYVNTTTQTLAQTIPTTNGFWAYVSGTQYVNSATQTLAQTIPSTNGFWAYVSGTQYVNTATQTLAQTIPTTNGFALQSSVPSTNGFWAYVDGTQYVNTATQTLAQTIPTTNGFIHHATSDGTLYGSKDGVWSAVPAAVLPVGTLIVTNNGMAGQFVKYSAGTAEGTQTGAWYAVSGAGDVMAAGDFTQFVGLGGTNGQVFISLGTGTGAWTNQSGSVTITTNGLWPYVDGTQYVNSATQTLAQTIPTTNGFATTIWVTSLGYVPYSGATSPLDLGAQRLIAGNTLYVTNSAVGINTNTPQTALHVVGGIIASNLTSATAGDALKYFRGDGTLQTISAGGGDAYLANDQTFAGTNTFTKTIIANGGISSPIYTNQGTWNMTGSTGMLTDATMNGSAWSFNPRTAIWSTNVSFSATAKISFFDSPSVYGCQEEMRNQTVALGSVYNSSALLLATNVITVVDATPFSSLTAPFQVVILDSTTNECMTVTNVTGSSLYCAWPSRYSHAASNVVSHYCAFNIPGWLNDSTGANTFRMYTEFAASNTVGIGYHLRYVRVQ